MQERISSREFAEWRAYYNIEPWGDDWLEAGQICSAVAALGGVKSKAISWTPATREKQTSDQMLTTFKAMASIHSIESNDGNSR